MRWSVLLAVLFAPASASSQTTAPDFSQSYAVWVSVENGQCLYWLANAGLNGAQLTETLSKGYQQDLGLEILTSRNTPGKCVEEAQAAAAKAGFKLVRARAATEKDGLRGIQ